MIESELIRNNPKMNKEIRLLTLLSQLKNKMLLIFYFLCQALMTINFCTIKVMN